MFGRYSYNQTLRKMTIAFGQIFNNIQIKRKDSSDNVIQTLKVPKHRLDKNLANQYF